MKHTELWAERQNFQLQRRTAPEGRDKRGKSAENRGPKGNRMQNSKPHFMNQIGICEND